MRIILAIVLLFAATAASASDDFGLITAIKGKASLKRINGVVIPLSAEKHLLRVLRNDEEIVTGADGSVRVAALQGNQVFELQPGSSVKITAGHLKTLKGKVLNKQGFPVPSRVGDRSIGVVVLSNTMRGGERPCLEEIRPLNTAAVADVTRISWRDACNAHPQPVAVSLGEPGGKTIFTGLSSQGFINIPAHTLKAGVRYTVTLEPVDSEGRVTGFLKVLDQGEVAELQAQRSAAQQGDEAGRVDFLLYLVAKDLYLEAKDEASRMEKEFPDNTYLKGLAKHLATW